MFREAGPVSLLALGMFFMPGLPAVLVQFLLGRRLRVWPGTWLAALLPLAAGLYGYKQGMALVESTLHQVGGSSLDPRVVVAMRAQGYHDAIQNARIGGGLTAILAALLLVAMAVNHRQRGKAVQGAGV